MTINSYGYDGSMSEAVWARYREAAGIVNFKHGVSSGFVVTPGGATRQVNISAGSAVLTSVLVESDASASKTFGANSGSKNRTDYLVIESNWSTNTATLAVVAGSSATPPALTQNAGVSWQMPLARIRVRAGATSILEADIEVCTPLPRVARPFVGSIDDSSSVAENAGRKTIGTIAITDPGDLYRVKVTATVGFSSETSGFGRLVASVTTGAGTTVLGKAQSGSLVAGGASANLNAPMSGLLSGPATVTLEMNAVLMSSGGHLVTNNGFEHFVVEQYPA